MSDQNVELPPLAIDDLSLLTTIAKSAKRGIKPLRVPYLEYRQVSWLRSFGITCKHTRVCLDLPPPFNEGLWELTWKSDCLMQELQQNLTPSFIYKPNETGLQRVTADEKPTRTTLWQFLGGDQSNYTLRICWVNDDGKQSPALTLYVRDDELSYTFPSLYGTNLDELLDISLLIDTVDEELTQEGDAAFGLKHFAKIWWNDVLTAREAYLYRGD